ncbi:MAG: hypothetical protein ACOZJX_09330 [Pseudomonadota bacterium]
MNHRHALTAAAALLASIAVQAQTAPAAYLERSQVLPTGQVIHAYRVPTTNASGGIRYWDVEMTLSVNDQGRIAGNAAVVAVPSPKVLGNNFVAGTYKSTDGVTCTVSVSILASGRQQGAISCGTGFPASWVTGLIPGHPFELDLLAAGVDKINGYDDYAWGKVGDTRGYVWWGCMNTGDVLSAVQVGDKLTLNGYDRGNVQVCGTTLTLQP